MKYLIITLIFIPTLFASDASFMKEAQDILAPIKKSFMKEITVGLEKGPYNAIESCHIKAPHLIEFEASDRLEFGRTSLKIRNESNAPKEWIKSILKEYQDSTAKNPKAPHVYKVAGKRVYIEPIYIKAVCLLCHGAPVESVQKKLKARYPKDKATGYKEGEFRGVFWIKEK